MRWQGRRESTNVEDRRGRGAVRGASLGAGGLILLLLVAWLTGVNPLQLLETVEQADVGSGSATGGPVETRSPEEDQAAHMVSVVLASTEDTWGALLPELGRPYERPKLVLFTGAVRSACGFTSAAAGPFYCPSDEKVYLDLGFFEELARRFGAPGDFARAYVVAHEVGHHVQKLLGISDAVERRQQAAGRKEALALSVRLELQADCLAGVWGYHANAEQAMLEPGDVEEGLAAAAAIGDDTLQRQSGRAVTPETWTHGSSAERARWLRRGLESGDPGTCDTFGAASL